MREIDKPYILRHLLLLYPPFLLLFSQLFSGIIDQSYSSISGDLNLRLVDLSFWRQNFSGHGSS